MSECTHNCSTCGESCAERATPQSLRKAPHPESHIGKVFGVVSGKGGVGKSMVTSQLAVTLHRRGYKVGVMDADITGPSIPQAFGVHDKAVGTQTALYPCVSHISTPFSRMYAKACSTVMFRFRPIYSAVIMLPALFSGYCKN